MREVTEQIFEKEQNWEFTLHRLFIKKYKDDYNASKKVRRERTPTRAEQEAAKATRATPLSPIVFNGVMIGAGVR